MEASRKNTIQVVFCYMKEAIKMENQMVMGNRIFYPVFYNMRDYILAASVY